jgi:DNA polymerase sigma
VPWYSASDEATDYSSMRVGDLRRLLLTRGLDPSECIEKSDMVSLLVSHNSNDAGLGSALGQEMVNFATYVAQDADEAAVRSKILLQLGHALDTLCPGLLLEQYGSQSLGMSTFSSDVDLCLVPKLPLRCMMK